MPMSLQADLSSVYATFSASVRSVGTACTLAVVGIYLHRRGFVIGDGKRTLALISQQVTIPLFLFTKIIYCNQDWSPDPCPDITTSLEDVWLLLFWPVYVVAAGLAVGYVVTKVNKTPSNQVRAVLACCAFGNSTGLPITLLTVVHANFPATSDLGRIDPTLFLSVYLLLYPVLQWGVGGWLVAPAEEATQVSLQQQQQGLEETSSLILVGNNSNNNSNGTLMDKNDQTTRTATPSHRLAHNVLNNITTEHLYNHSRRGLSETDASLYMSVQEDLNMWDDPNPPNTYATMSSRIVGNKNVERGFEQPQQPTTHTTIPYAKFTSPSDPSDIPKNPITNESSELLPLSPLEQQLQQVVSNGSSSSSETITLWVTLQKIGTRCLQPPVVGAICGMVVAATPLRGIFVDLVDRQSRAPLQWLFDGLYQVGQAAVPMNMMILGCNLSASYTTQRRQQQQQQHQQTQGNVDPQESSKLLDRSTMVGVVIGKMLILPMVGFLSTYLLKISQILDIPDDIDGSFYLVLMIVFLTPTANNVMVMVELSGSGTKEGIAQAIAWQYMSAPFILSLTMSIAVGMADNWS
jgi:predicted permease